MYRYRDRDGASSDSEEEKSTSPIKMSRGHSSSPMTTATMDLDSKPEKNVINNTKKRKVNNVWSSVVQEQTINDDMCKVNMSTLGDRLGWERGCESYDFTRKSLDPRPDPSSDEELDLDYGVSDIENEFETSETNMSSDNKSKKKGIVKVHLVEKQEDATKIGREVARRLAEPKVDLIQRCVQVLGRKKVFDLLHMTEDIEDDGGMLIVNGSRRRTPGGVFLYQLRKDREIGKKEKDYIFAEDRAKYEQLKKAHKKMAMRKKNVKKPKPVKMEMEDSEPVPDATPDTTQESPSEVTVKEVSDNAIFSTAIPAGETSMQVPDSKKEDQETNNHDTTSDVELEEGEIL